MSSSRTDESDEDRAARHERERIEANERWERERKEASEKHERERLEERAAETSRQDERADQEPDA